MFSNLFLASEAVWGAGAGPFLCRKYALPPSPPALEYSDRILVLPLGLECRLFSAGSCAMNSTDASTSFSLAGIPHFLRMASSRSLASLSREMSTAMSIGGLLPEVSITTTRNGTSLRLGGSSGRNTERSFMYLASSPPALALANRLSRLRGLARDAWWTDSSKPLLAWVSRNLRPKRCPSSFWSSATASCPLESLTGRLRVPNSLRPGSRAGSGRASEIGGSTRR
mmetsp:Transcript_17511/g.43227  ORF Transcript_17511/g.43227 Transcript_17511/m.43227 type:complete len:226 (+) Transcript_17511:930-1607(+)